MVSSVHSPGATSEEKTNKQTNKAVNLFIFNVQTSKNTLMDFFLVAVDAYLRAISLHQKILPSSGSCPGGAGG